MIAEVHFVHQVHSVHFLLSSVLIMAIMAAAWGEALPGNGANPEAVQEVAAGKRTAANAAWWGFDPQDATQYLQAAINSGAATVIVPYMGAEWVVTPITLASNQEVVFEPGVVVLAKQGEFKGKGDSLFTARNAHDIVLRGYGATWRMRKADYQRAPYDKAEWRMTLDLAGCSRVQVLGLRLESSGGDGIYVGVGEQPYCQDVTVRDVVCFDHHRQGISVISAINVLVENCVLANTGGTAPEAGIDFEPNVAEEKLVNCVMRRCVFENNDGAGILLYLKNLSRASDPVSIRVEDCFVRSGRDAGIGVGAVRDDGPQGTIEFTNCTIENTRKCGLFVYDKSADSARVQFINCRWNRVATIERDGGERKASGVPILLTSLRAENTKRNGGIDFVDCYVYDTFDRPVVVAEDEGHDLGIHDVKGLITVHNPLGARMDLRCKPDAVELQLRPAEK